MLATLALLLALASPGGERIDGRWEGAIQVMGRALNIAVDFKTAPEGLQASIDIPQQGAEGLALTAVRVALPEIPDLRLFPGVLAGALAAACLTAAIATAVSVRVPVARAAQQMATMITTVLAAITAGLLRQFSVPLDWATVLRAHQVTFCAGLLGLLITMRFFRRDRVFDTR